MSLVRNATKVFLLLASVGGVSLPGRTLAQPATDDASLIATESVAASAPVMIDGRVLFKVRGVSAFPAETRAVAILSRIIVLAAAETLAPARSTRSVSRGASYAVTYQLNVYCDHAIGMYRLYTELHRNVLDVFNQYNVQIMTPSYMADPAEPKLVPKDQWFAKPAKSGEVPIQRKMVGEK